LFDTETVEAMVGAREKICGAMEVLAGVGNDFTGRLDIVSRCPAMTFAQMNFSRVGRSKSSGYFPLALTAQEF
jgi:hypothetical protein